MVRQATAGRGKTVAGRYSVNDSRLGTKNLDDRISTILAADAYIVLPSTPCLPLREKVSRGFSLSVYIKVPSIDFGETVAIGYGFSHFLRFVSTFSLCYNNRDD